MLEGQGLALYINRFLERSSFPILDLDGRGAGPCCTETRRAGNVNMVTMYSNALRKSRHSGDAGERINPTELLRVTG